MIRAIAAPASLVVASTIATFLLPSWAAWGTVPYSLFFILDSALRYRDYRKLMQREYITIGTIRAHRYSFCQRQVCIAADGMYLGMSAAQWYYVWGYRWYHIFPDHFPKCLLNKRWWKSFFRG